jgi:hypothetical protein
MLKLIIPILLMLAVYAYSRKVFSKKNGRQLNANWLRTIKFIHFLSLLICLINPFLIIQFNHNFRGVWTIEICIFLCILSWFLIVFSGKKSVKTNLEKLYYLLFILGFIVTSPLLLFGVIASKSKIYYEDNHIRIERSVGLMPAPRHIIYQKKGLVEKFIFTQIFNVQATDSISVNYAIDSTEITFFMTNTEENNPFSDRKNGRYSFKMTFEKLN